MAIYQILDALEDARKGGEQCEFNGYLEDYLDVLAEKEDSPVKHMLQKLFDANPDLKICVNLRAEINRTVISNQIIRYKDAFKLQGAPVICPMVVYGKCDGVERAVILVEHSERSYLYAKGLYYTLTEPYSPFVDCKNDIVALSADDSGVFDSVLSRLFKAKAGALQREVDRGCFNNYDQLKADALAEAEDLRANAATVLKAAEDKEKAIYALVVKWFLLKKVVYVQYMVNKDILTKVHEGNIKKQRNQAKINADEIPFVSYSELWRSI